MGVGEGCQVRAGEGVSERERTVGDDGPDLACAVLSEDLSGETDRPAGVDEVVDEDASLAVHFVSLPALTLTLSLS